MKKAITTIIIAIMVLTFSTATLAENYSFTNLVITGGSSQTTIKNKQRNETNSLDLKATSIDWCNTPSDQRNPKFRGYLAGTSTPCTYAKTIEEGKYRKANYTTSSMSIKVDIKMSIDSSNASHKIKITGNGVV